MSWNSYISEMKKRWIGRKVTFNGSVYNVVDVDMNGALLIDMPTKYTESHTNPTTAVDTWMVKEI